MSAGTRAAWFDKHRPDVMHIDIREKVRPDVVANSKLLPFRDGTFDLIVFDPPHVNGGAKSNISRDYGHHTTAGIRELISLSAREAHRVGMVGCRMAFKWNDHDQRLEAVLDLVDEFWQPLFGSRVSERSLRASRTCWVMLDRKVL
jgi:hypothetical protein